MSRRFTHSEGKENHSQEKYYKKLSDLYTDLMQRKKVADHLHTAVFGNLVQEVSNV